MEETNCVSLKLLIDTESQRVLFAEAGKEFIDFLLHILALPLGTFIPLFEKQGMLGSFGNIYESIDNLRSIDDYLQPDVDKETLLKAKVDNSKCQTLYHLRHQGNCIGVLESPQDVTYKWLMTPQQSVPCARKLCNTSYVS